MHAHACKNNNIYDDNVRTYTIIIYMHADRFKRIKTNSHAYIHAINVDMNTKLN